MSLAIKAAKLLKLMERPRGARVSSLKLVVGFGAGTTPMLAVSDMEPGAPCSCKDELSEGAGTTMWSP